MLKEHQEMLGYTSLLHINLLKRTKKRLGQLDHFNLIESSYRPGRVTIPIISKTLENIQFRLIQRNAIQTSSLLKMEKTRATAVQCRRRFKLPIEEKKSYAKTQTNPLFVKLYVIMRRVVKKIKRFHISKEVLFNRVIVPRRPFFALSSSEFLKACLNDNVDKVRLFLDSDRFLIFEYTKSWQNSYHLAAKRNNHVTLYYLIKQKGDLEMRDITGRTPLHWAVEFGFEESISLLVAAGANPFGIKQDSILISKAKVLWVLSFFGKRRTERKIWENKHFVYYNEFSIFSYEQSVIKLQKKH